MSTTMMRMGLAALAATALCAGGAAAQDAVRGKRAGDIVVGVGAVGVLPDGGGRTTIGGRPHASDAASPLLDVTYFLQPRLALNLIAATTRHDLTLTGSALPGTARLGSVWVLPPTLTLQVHPFPQARFSPYVGLGLNATFFYGYGGSLTPPVRRVRVETAFGPSFNVGVDYEIAPNWLANIDVKKVLLSPDVSVNSRTITGHADLNPWVVSAAVRYRF